jgi:hypothetical protein
MEMSRAVLVAAYAAALLVASGCTTSQRRNPCAEVVAPCDTPAATRCGGESDAVETCLVDPTGCLAWAETAACGGPGTCLAQDGGAACDEDCVDECGAAGEGRCVGELVQDCTRSAVGCLFWADGEDCGAIGEQCRLDGPTAFCSEGCVEDCTLGAERCREGWVETCRQPAGCPEWVPTLDCASGGAECVESADGAACAGGCGDPCVDEGATACADGAVEVCIGAEDGCLSWVVQRDCGAEELVCVDGADGATCACPAGCEPGATRCAGAAVEACASDERGCGAWAVAVECGAFEQECVEAGGVAACAGGGDSCADALALASFPATVAGDSFSADAADDQTFTGAGCEARPGSPEMILAVVLDPGERLWVTERGDIDVVVSVQGACDPAGECLLSLDDFDEGGFVFEPPAPGPYWIVVETSGPATAAASYEVEVDVLRDEDCGDGVDNDRDGEVDCADDACFGDPVWCSAERDCADGDDNDRDRLVDCEDPDCAATAACGPLLGVWEQFAADEWLDLSGTSLTFAPDASAPMGYSWRAAGGLTDYPERPGTGTTTILALGDDAFEEVALGAMGSFELYGTRYDRLFVSSNGLVSFGVGTTSYTPTPAELFARPTIAVLWSDLNPAAGGGATAVTVDEHADRVVVTWDGVPRYGASEPNDVQLVLGADGTIAMHFVGLSPPHGSQATIVGLADGEGIGALPAETDFVTFAPEAACGDGLDNDGDGATDCRDPDCDGAPGCVETACGDGLDDDGDGATDCGDADCFGDPRWCAREDLCDDGADNDGDGDTDCDDSDCDDPWVCEPFHGLWERFDRGDPSDLAGTTITFVPDDAAPEGYRWSVARAPAGGYPVAPGSGATSTLLTMTDDDFEELVFAHLPGFAFYGIDYAGLFVGSNGYVTFGAGSTRPESDPADHFALPSVAGMRADLDPAAGGTIAVDEDAGWIAVTWQGVPRWRAPDPAAEPNDFQIVLRADGSIDITTLTASVTPCLVGIANSIGNGTTPGETSFVP